MEITVNGKRVSIEANLCLAAFIAQRGFKPQGVVVEYNGVIAPAASWTKILLTAGDQLEIVTFVGGG